MTVARLLTAVAASRWSDWWSPAAVAIGMSGSSTPTGGGGKKAKPFPVTPPRTVDVG